MQLFGARLPLDPECKPFVFGCAAVAGALFVVGLPWWLWIWPLLGLGICLAFFRDPNRRAPSIPRAVASPADGTVVDIRTNENPDAGPVGGPCISIFLSVFNVHVARAPYDGVIVARKGQMSKSPGVYLDARDPRSADENKAEWLFMECDRARISIRLVAGLVARQIVTRVGVGDTVRRGQRIGIIRFGSRTEIYLPPASRVQVEVGQAVSGATTILAYLPGE